MRHSKEAEEKEIFTMFARVCPIGVKLDSIKNQKPRKPDIVCESSVAGWISYEMVRLDYEEFTKVISEKCKVQRKFSDSWQKLPDNRRSELLKKFGNFSISVEFKPNLPPGQWKESIPFIWEILLKLSSSLKGDVPIQNYPAQEYLTKMKITPGDGKTSDVPSLHVILATEVLNRVLERLAQKFQNTYKSEHPIELLAYYDLQHPPWNCVAGIEKYVIEHLGNSPFTRVWIFDCMGRTIKFVYPPCKILSQ